MLCDPEPKLRNNAAHSATPPIIQRAALARRVMAAQGRWINIYSAAGMGRTTLLGQIADEFLLQRDWFHAIWTRNHLDQALAAIGRKKSRDLRPLVRWLRIQSQSSASGIATLLIDDYDGLFADEYRELLEELMASLDTLRVIVTTVDPLALHAGLEQRGIGEITHFGATELLLSREETNELAAAAAAQHPHVEAFADAAVLQRLHEITRGVPLAVTLSLALLAQQVDDPEYQFSQVMNRTITTNMRARMRQASNKSVSQMCCKLSLMPRFSYVHITASFPDTTPVLLTALAELPVLDVERRVRAGDFAWSTEFLIAAREFNSVRIAERRELAADFYRRHLAGGAFEQWFLAGDLAKAEAMLRTRFLTVFETLSPETACEVHSYAPSELAAYPMIRVMQTLLEPRATVKDLQMCVDSLGALGARGGATGLLANAVRAAVLARKGAGKLACEQAEQVLSEAEDVLLDSAEETQAEQRTVAEASLTAVLTLFELKTMPERLAVIPIGHGSPFLRYRRERVQQFLDHLRAESVIPTNFMSNGVPNGYRALVFSENKCSASIAALTRYDKRFLEILREDNTATSTDIQRDHEQAAPVEFFAMAAECLRLLALGDYAGASEEAFGREACGPQSTILRATVLLATGREREARELLEEPEYQQGARVKGTWAVLKACALMRLGFEQPARFELRRAEGLPE